MRRSGHFAMSIGVGRSRPFWQAPTGRRIVLPALAAAAVLGAVPDTVGSAVVKRDSSAGVAQTRPGCLPSIDTSADHARYLPPVSSIADRPAPMHPAPGLSDGPAIDSAIHDHQVAAEAGDSPSGGFPWGPFLLAVVALRVVVAVGSTIWRHSRPS
jgi:hypothetical protein